MSPRRILLAPLVTVLGGSALAVVPGSAPAFADVTPQAAAEALDLPAGVTASIAGSGSVESQAFNDFPSQGSQYLVLSTGLADDALRNTPLAIDDPATSANEWQSDGGVTSTDRGSDDLPDTSTLTLTVEPGAGRGCLYVDFAMATDETLRLASPQGDALSVQRQAEPSVEYARNVGRGYFDQSGWPAQPVPYTVNNIDFWHQPGDRSDVLDGQLESPRLLRWTPLDNVTTRDTARVPLTFEAGAAEVVEISIADGPEDTGETDSAAFLDNVRFTASCSSGSTASPTQQYGEGSIEGDRRVGYPLTYDPFPTTAAIERYDAADNGWSYPGKTSPVDLRFRWYRTKSTCPSGGLYTNDMNNWLVIPNADRQSYVPTNLDRGRCLIVLVSGVADGRPTATFPTPSEAITTPVKWYETLPIDYGVFQDGATPTINHDGTPKVGETITVSAVPTRPLQDSWSYQWYANGSSISGAESGTLVLGAAQRGKTITVKATASRSGFTSKSWTSAATPTVAGDVMESVGSPYIAEQPDSEQPSVGDVLAAEGGPGWPAGTAFTYQWRRAGSNISGADQATYTTSASDAGKVITVVVSGSKSGYDPVPVVTAGVTVKGAPMSGTVPTISGTAKVGVRLTASATGWVPSPSYTYAWYAGSTLLQSGTSRSYTPTAATAGQRIEVRVTGTRSGYEPLTMVSEPTAPVARGSLSVGSLRITGTLKVGYTVRAYKTGWGPSPVVYKYRWKIGSSYVTGTAGTRSYLKLPSRARGKRVTLVMTVSKTGYTTVSKSAVSSAVR